MKQIYGNVLSNGHRISISLDDKCDNFVLTIEKPHGKFEATMRVRNLDGDDVEANVIGLHEWVDGIVLKECGEPLPDQNLYASIIYQLIGIVRAYPVIGIRGPSIISGTMGTSL